MLSKCICSESVFLEEKNKQDCVTPMDEPGIFEIHRLVKEKTEPRMLFS